MRIRFFALLISLAMPTLTLADTTYTYIGHEFTSAPSPFTTSDFVSVSLTLPSQLPTNLTSFTQVNPISFTISDGLTTITALNTAGAEFITDSAGDILYWNVSASNSAGSFIQTVWGTNNTGLDSGQVRVANVGIEGLVRNDPGIWTVNSSSPIVTPEPAALYMVGTGLLSLAGIARLRYARP